VILIYSVRRATIADHDDIKALHSLLFIGPVEDMPSLNKGYWWVLQCHNNNNNNNNKRTVGFAGLTKSLWYQSTGYLSRVGIHPRHQGRGLHKRLLRPRERLCRTLLWEWVVTDTAPDNYPSSNSLIRSGYTLFKPWFRWAENKSSLYWAKKL
jgi:ribosomal protein S18 acetylase RimI-like enzyme